MPTLWKYILSNYLKIFFLSVCAFVAILLTARLEEIAHFAGMGGTGWPIVRFTLYQIPFILPIAIPISALIAAFLLTQHLAQGGELTALRSSGYSLFEIAAPIIAISLVLSLLNFYLVSEVTSRANYKAYTLREELRSINPMLVLRNRHLMKLKGFYFEPLGPSHYGTDADDAIVAFPDIKHKRVRLVLAKKLYREGEKLLADHLSILATLSGTEGDIVMVDNLRRAGHDIPPTPVMNRDDGSPSLSQMPSSMLMQKIVKASPSAEKAHALSEFYRRASISLAVSTLSFIGFSFGIQTSRQGSRLRLIALLSYTALYLICYFLAGGLAHRTETAFILFFGPNLINTVAASLRLRQATQGAEV